MLSTIKFNLFNSSVHYNDKLMIWAAMATAFFGFLLLSAYTSSHVNSFIPEAPLSYNNITVQINQFRGASKHPRQIRLDQE
jgi:hypothetical protein